MALSKRSCLGTAVAQTADPIRPTGKAAISGTWLDAAAKLCVEGRLPLVKGVPRATQAAQLARAIQPDRLVIALAVTGIETSEPRMLGLAKAAEWLAKETNAQVLALLPRLLARYSALDTILYGAEDVAAPIHGDDEGVTGKARLAEARYRVLPVVGRPHPFSPGEKLLAATLGADSELGPLFGFNLFVDTVNGTHLLVDLLWRKGKVVVEVDSYQYHKGREAFAIDRQRDYELTIGGYTVLRLTHDEVLERTAAAVAKIRDVVRDCRDPM